VYYVLHGVFVFLMHFSGETMTIWAASVLERWAWSTGSKEWDPRSKEVMFWSREHPERKLHGLACLGTAVQQGCNWGVSISQGARSCKIWHDRAEFGMTVQNGLNFRFNFLPPCTDVHNLARQCIILHGRAYFGTSVHIGFPDFSCFLRLYFLGVI